VLPRRQERISARFEELGLDEYTYVPISFSCFARFWDLPRWDVEHCEQAVVETRETLQELRSYLAAHPADWPARIQTACLVSHFERAEELFQRLLEVDETATVEATSSMFAARLVPERADTGGRRR
jgi:hypothetical protein